MCSRGDDRDERFLMQAVGRGAQLKRNLRAQPCKQAVGWGGALRRMQSTNLAPSREDERALVSLPGRYVPIGFARYASPVIDPAKWEYYRVAGWRVAVPRSVPSFRTRDLLYRIFYFGPASAGYVRLGDTLVPAILEPGDRMILAQSAVAFEAYPLST